MKNGCRLSFLLFLMLCLTVADADVFHLKGGGLLEGEVVEKSEGYVIIKLRYGGTQKIKEDEIVSIEKSEFSVLPSGKKDERYKNKSWLYNQAVYYSRLRQYNRALAYIKKLLELYPEEAISSKAKKLEEKIRGKIAAEKMTKDTRSAKGETEMRKKALLLGINQDAPSLNALIELLKSNDVKIKSAAIDALSLRKDKRALVPLREGLSSKDALIREKTVRALGEFRDKAAAGLILPLLADKKSSAKLRKAAAIALGQIGSKKATEGLTQALRDKDTGVRHNVIHSLGKIGDEKASWALILALKREDLRMRIEIYKALGNIADARVVKPLLNEVVDERAAAQEQIIAALGKIGTESAVNGLIKLLKYLENEVLLEKVITVLGNLKGEKIIPAIAMALQHPSTRVRRKAAGTLGMMKDKKAIAFLEKALEDPSDSVRMEAARAIQNIKKKD